MHHGSARLSSVIRRTASLACLVSLTMCANLDNIDVSTGGKATIPAATLLDKLLGSVAFGGFNKVDFSEELENQGVKPGEVDAVHVKSMTLIVEAPSSGNFDFISSVHFFAKAEGLDKIEIASIASVPRGKRELDLAVTGVDLKRYVTAPSMQISSEVVGARPDEETTVAAAAVLDVDVHIPGCN